MPDHTVSGDVDSMLRSANDAAIRSAIGVGQTDAPTFLAQTLTGQSLTGTQATSLVDLATTWLSTTGTPTAIKLNVTDTASNAASLLMDLQVGGVSQYSFRKGAIACFRAGCSAGPDVGFECYTAGASAMTRNVGGRSIMLSVFSTGLRLSSDYTVGWSGNLSGSGDCYGIDTILARDAAGILAQRNGVNAQAFRVANSVGASPLVDYDRGVFDFKTTTNTLRIGTENGGTYTTARPIDFVTGGVVRMSIAAGGGVDLPASGAASGVQQLNVNRIIFAGEGYRVGNTYQVVFSNGADYARGIGVSASGGLSITNGTTGGQSLQFVEMTAPAAPATNGVRIYAEDNGAGKTRIMALFATGVAQQIAIEP